MCPVPPTSENLLKCPSYNNLPDCRPDLFARLLPCPDRKNVPRPAVSSYAFGVRWSRSATVSCESAVRRAISDRA